MNAEVDLALKGKRLTAEDCEKLESVLSGGHAASCEAEKLGSSQDVAMVWSKACVWNRV